MTRRKAAVHELLVMECYEDGLNPAQVEQYKKGEREMLEFKRKLEVVNQTNRLVSPAVVPQPVVTAAQPLLIQNTQTPHNNNIMVLEQNGVHLVMGNVPPAPTNNVTPKSNAINFAQTAVPNRTPRILSQARTSTTSLRSRPGASKHAAAAAVVPTTSSSQMIKIQFNPSPAITENMTVPNVQNRSLRPMIQQMSEQVVDLTDDDNVINIGNNNTNASSSSSLSNNISNHCDISNTQEQQEPSSSDQREIAIGKVSEKTFPSLVVIVRVFLRAKEIPSAIANQERTKLDARVKRVLMLSATTFTEWLLQQGLLKCEQFCALHRGENGTSNNLKLGMYSDASKFPYSGGYVWISECCPTTFVSVFSGSLFEGAPHPPTIVLKLIYHWACQTIVQNVLQWVRVDNLYVKTMYTNLRAACTAAIHEKYGKLGGFNKRVEVGVISLGTTTQDGSMKHIKVEVLGVLDTETKKLRLKALEPIADNDKQFMKKKFLKVLEPLQQWVDKDSLIITDNTVDKVTCYKMGFTNVIQNAHGTQTTSDMPTNQTIMDYLRKVIPKMFQNTLSLLSRQIIQQFLDELVWRETWGQIPSRAFDNIIQDLSEQTRLDTGGSLIHRLARIAGNPLKNWRYDKWASNCRHSGTTCSTSSENSTPDDFDQQPSTSQAQAVNNGLYSCLPSTSTGQGTSSAPEEIGPAKIALEPYYYGTIAGDPKLASEKYCKHFKCILCKEEYLNVMKFTDHLILHAFNKNVRDNADIKELCKLCLKICPKTNNQNLSTHRIQVHSDRQTCRTLCKICSVKHRDPTSLQSHMVSSHCELDMPYHCDICKYRTSILDDIHNHFNIVHSKGTKGYCPYCLKIMQFSTITGRNLINNQLRFVLHIQKHQLTVNRKCEKCLLNFTNRDILKDHQDYWHQSCKLLDAVERYAIDECTLMDAPLIDPLPASTVNIETSRGTLKLSFDPSKEFCCECDGKITSGHFVGHMMCTKCRFQTCCNASMKEHNALVHGTSLLHLRPPVIGIAPILENPLFCICGYTTHNGNYMAGHLVECGHLTTYCNKRALLHEMNMKKGEEVSAPVKRRKYEDGY